MGVLNFDFSPEQLALRESARRFFEQECPPSMMRVGQEGESGAGQARGLWEKMARLGYLSAVLRGLANDAGSGYLELCVIAEELGRALAPVPLGAAVLAAELLAGVGEQGQQLLQALVEAKAIFCVIDGRGTVDFLQGKVTGISGPVPDSSLATAALVIADDPQCGLVLLHVDLAEPRLTRENQATVDGSRGLQRLVFAGVSAERIGLMGDAAQSYASALERTVAVVAFEQLGGADRCLEIARQYAIDREAFGRPIGSFQAVKHKLVDIYVKNTIARAHAYYAAWALEADAEDLPLAAAAARASATDAFRFAAQEAIHVHGGIGFTWEHDCHLYLRRAQLLSTAYGSPDEWKEKLVRELEFAHPAMRG